MDRTERIVRNMLTAIEAPLYDIGVLSSRGMLPGLDAIPGSTVLERLSVIKYRNAGGSHIYLRPSGEHHYTVLDDLKREAAATSKQVRGRVRLTCWPTFGKRLILPSIPRLIEQFPGLSVDLDLSEMVHAPVLELTDLAIRVSRQQNTAMLQTKLGTQSSLVVASPGYVAKHGKPDNLDDCLQHRLIDKRHRRLSWAGAACLVTFDI